ncbi:hypothetical protein Dimus_018557, partial [Dionaea muscipula]
MEVYPAFRTAVPESTAQSSATPTPPQKMNLQRGILNLINQAPKARIAAAYIWVNEGLFPRDQDILLATNPKRLQGAMMVNATEEEDLREEEKKKRKFLHDEIATLKKNQEIGRYTLQQLQDDKSNLQRDLQAKVDAKRRAVQELSKVQSTLKSAEKMVTTQNETVRELRAENQSLKERVEHNKKNRREMTSVLNEYDERLK